MSDQGFSGQQSFSYQSGRSRDQTKILLDQQTAAAIQMAFQNGTLDQLEFNGDYQLPDFPGYNRWSNGFKSGYKKGSNDARAFHTINENQRMQVMQAVQSMNQPGVSNGQGYSTGSNFLISQAPNTPIGTQYNRHGTFNGGQDNSSYSIASMGLRTSDYGSQPGIQEVGMQRSSGYGLSKYGLGTSGISETRQTGSLAYGLGASRTSSGGPNGVCRSSFNGGLQDPSVYESSIVGTSNVGYGYDLSLPSTSGSAYGNGILTSGDYGVRSGDPTPISQGNYSNVQGQSSTGITGNTGSATGYNGYFSGNIGVPSMADTTNYATSSLSSYSASGGPTIGRQSDAVIGMTNQGIVGVSGASGSDVNLSQNIQQVGQGVDKGFQNVGQGIKNVGQTVSRNVGNVLQSASQPVGKAQMTKGGWKSFSNWFFHF